MADSSSPVDEDSLISSFAGITGADSGRSRFFLELSDWNIDLAVSNFFDSDQGTGGHEDYIAIDQEEEQVGHDLTPGLDELTPLRSHFLSPPSPEPSSGQRQESTDKMSKGNDKPKIATLGSLRNRSDDGEESDEGQAFYAGGSDRSGQQILGPPRKKDPEKIVKEMFESAKQHGGQVLDDPSFPGPSRRGATEFSGSGYRLGSETDPSVPVSSGVIPNLETIEAVNMVLKLWRNGFSIDDGPLRSYSDPENAEFLMSIRQGEIPRELISKARGGEVNLNMEDHKQEEYVEVKKPVKAFEGEGHRLGNVAPSLTSTEIPSDDQSTQKANEAAAQSELNVDPSQPVTNIQVRLADGSRLVLKINTNQTIDRIRQFICRARPAMNAVPFKLLTTFPNKELDNEEQSIAEASLQNASIVQRLL